MDDAQIYEYDHGGGHEQSQNANYGGHDAYNQQQGKDYYGDHYGHQDRGDQGRRNGRDDMW